MWRYGIGLDIGITSVGWATIALDDEDNPKGILDLGVRIFDAAENPKDGSSLAKPRREKRSMRRQIRRRRHRNERIRYLLQQSGVISEKELAHLFEGRLSDIYALRVKALDEICTPAEFARILIHIGQRRGFRSNRRNPTDAEDGKLLQAVNENRERMTACDYSTVAEMLYKDAAFSQSKRNKGGQYITTVSRDLVEEEVHKIFDAQRKLGSTVATEELEEKYLGILLAQRSFDEGPGAGSPYAGNQIERMAGHCTFEQDKVRAPKATYSFEYFTLLDKVNHLRLVENGKGTPLTQKQRQKLIDKAHKTENLDFAEIRKELDIPPSQTFNLVTYHRDATVEENEKKTKFSYLKAFHRMRKAFNKADKKRFALLSVAERNAIGTALTYFKTESKIRAFLQEQGLQEEDIQVAESIGSFSKFGHLSVEACDKLIPHLEKGLQYHEACEAAGYNFRAHDGTEKAMLLKPTEDTYADITSPVVKRAVAQSIKVINAIIRDRGCSPVYLNIELAREMSKDFAERRKIKKEADDNQAQNDRIMNRIRTEYGKIDATGQDLLKLKLYEEQAGVCPYSQKQMSLEKLFSPGYAEIDHIIPYSISFDDSRKNKVLVLAAENRNKGKRLPLEYLTGKRRDDYIVWVNNSVRDFRKRQIMLKEAITEEDRNSFIERNLQDTKHIASFMLNYINDNLLFTDFANGRKKHVTAVNGAITSYMRKRWGIAKIRENGDLHHAVDAVVIACTTDGMIQQISRYAEFRECEYVQSEEGSLAVDRETGELLRKFPYPWYNFRNELDVRLLDNPANVIGDLRQPFYLEDEAPAVHPIFVSRMPKRKVTGPAHKETNKSARELENGYTLKKVELKNLKLDDDGEIANYYYPGSDPLLYEALKKRLREYDNNGEKAFKEPFYKPKKDGTPGPLVRKVKMMDPTTLNVSVLNGNAVADNDTMIRIDIFKVPEDGYYFVPIYIADTLKPELPCKAFTSGRAYKDWKEMQEEHFVFSLYPNDLVKVVHPSLMNLSCEQKESTLQPKIQRKEEFLYYIKSNIASGQVTFLTHDAAYSALLGIKTLTSIEKYTVDVLGNYYPVKKEKRQGFFH